MNLFNVRKGLIVYYENELHRVYAVKPMYKKSVHLIRLRDLTQHLSSAAEVERYQPKEHDSFIFNKKVYTLSNERKAEVGDYILITHPNPDVLDHYTLNQIEVVATVENKGVITTNSNGIMHNEYLLMVPGRLENSHPIEYRDMTLVQNESSMDQSDLKDDFLPSIGDVYQKLDDSSLMTMVVGIHGTRIFLGGGLTVAQEELLDTEKWDFLYNIGG